MDVKFPSSSLVANNNRIESIRKKIFDLGQLSGKYYSKISQLKRSNQLNTDDKAKLEKLTTLAISAYEQILLLMASIAEHVTYKENLPKIRFNLGSLYYDINNYEKALIYLHQVGNKGHARTNGIIAEIYFKQKKFKQALKHYKLGLNKSLPYFDFKLAGMYIDGKGTRPAPKSALEIYLSLAAKHEKKPIGHKIMGPVYFNLHLLYAGKCSAEKNASVLQVENLRLAAKCNYVIAQQNLGLLLSDGSEALGIDIDSKQACVWFQRAWKKGLLGSKLSHAITLNQSKQSTQQDFVLAYNLLLDLSKVGKDAKLSEKDRKGAAFTLANSILFGKGTQKNPAEAIEMLKKFIESKDPEYCNKALHNIGDYYLSKNDFVKAASYYRRAAIDGHADSQFNLAVFYRFGFGVEVNLLAAISWFDKAAKYFGLARKMLVGIYAELIMSLTTTDSQREKYTKLLHNLIENSSQKDGQETWRRCSELEQSLVDSKHQAAMEQIELIGRNLIPEFISTNRDIYREARNRGIRPNQKLLNIFIILDRIKVFDHKNIVTFIYNVGELARQLGPNRPTLLIYRDNVEKLIARTTDLVHQFSATEAAKVVDGISKLNLQAQDSQSIMHCLDLIFTRVEKELKSQINANDLTKILTAIAHLDLTSSKRSQYLQAINQKIIDQHDSFSINHKIKLLYANSMIKANYHTKKLVPMKFYKSLADECMDVAAETTDRKMVGYKQVHQYNLCTHFVKHLFPEYKRMMEIPVDEDADVNAERKNSTVKSKLETEVGEFLYKHFSPEECLANYDINGLPVDYFIPKNKIVIQVDGPTHYFYGKDKDKPRQTCKDIFHDVIIKYDSRKLKIVHVPYFKWDQLKTDKEKLNFLKEQGVIVEKVRSPRIKHAS